jgi:hypothetical protein
MASRGGGGGGGAAAGGASAAAGSENAQAHLSSGVLDLVPLREVARRELINILDGINDDVALVLDPDLIGPLGLVAEASLLKEHRVTKIFTLEGTKSIPSEFSSVLYLVRPSIDHMYSIAAQIQSSDGKGADRHRFNYVYFTPRKTLQCESTLANLAVHGDIEIGEYHLDLIPYDEDLLTMSLPNSFRSLFLDGDTSLCFYAARSLLKMQKLYGKFGNVLGKGNAACQVIKLMKRMENEEELINLNSGEADYDQSADPSGLGASTMIRGEIDTLVIIDRTVDMVTPLLTQVTYEGLIDEVFGVQDNYVEISKSVLGIKDKDGNVMEGKTKLVLTSGDSLYKDIRDLNFSLLGPFLKRRAAYIAQVYEERHKAETISQISEFMKKFKNLNKEHTSLQHHINLAEKIALEQTRQDAFQKRIQQEMNFIKDDQSLEDYIEDLIGKGEQLEKVLKLLCLYSVVSNGLKQKRLEYFKREIIQTYGFPAILTLMNLEKAGLLQVYQSRSSWSSLRKQLRLFEDQKSQGEGETLDASTVFEGYTPVSARLVQSVTEAGSFKLINDVSRLIPGEEHSDDPNREGISFSIGRSASEGPQVKDPITLVFFLGGITFAEASSFRLLSKDSKQNRDYVVATTHFINGNKIMNEVTEKLANNLDISSV